MNYTLPQINTFTQEEWSWPFYKFGLKREELFTTIHDRFNLHQLPLQDPMAFHRDVCESAHHSATLEEFYSQMEERKTQRIEEMKEAWRSVCLSVTTDYLVLACPLCYDPETDTVRTKPGTLNDSVDERWHLFNYFSRTLSFDTLIRFFDGFVRDNREEDDRLWGPYRERMRRWREEQAAKRAAAAAEGTEAASQSRSEAAYSQPESSYDMPSPEIPDEQPRRSSTRRRHTAATSPSTTASPTARKRGGDEDSQGSQRKRRRASTQSVGDDAVWIAAEQGGSGSEESASTTTRQAENRRRTNYEPNKQRNNRTRRYSPHSEEGDELLHRCSSSDEQESNGPQRPLFGMKNVHKRARKRRERARIFIDPQKAFYLPSEDGSEEEDEDAPTSVIDPQKAFYLPSEDRSEDVASTQDPMPTLVPKPRLETMPRLEPVEETQGLTTEWAAANRNSMPTLDPWRTQDFRAGWSAPTGYSISTLDPMETQWPTIHQEPLSSRASSPDSYHTCPEAAADEEVTDSGLAGAQSSSQEDTEGPAANDAINEAANARKQKKKSRALHRQRVENRRSSEMSETSPPPQRPRQRESRRRSISAPVEQLLQSGRSSRRNAGQTLFFLADDATACVASGNRSI